MNLQEFVPSSPFETMRTLRIPAFVVIVNGIFQSIYFIILNNGSLGGEFFSYGILWSPQIYFIAFGFGIWIAVSLHRNKMNFVDTLISTYLIGLFFGIVHISSILVVDDPSYLTEISEIMQLALGYANFSMIAGLVTWGILREIELEPFSNKELYPIDK
ncbi:MAG: hypothetical protein GPJ54_14300 [Candidatus Heimdallarchaeota archaeon]|nr:hypothetical protein [Candidatus Heimdallarchaeota archaeon]